MSTEKTTPAIPETDPPTPVTWTNPEHPRLIEQIKKLHYECIGHWNSALAQAIECGELVAKVKRGLKHGEWLPWIEANLPFSARTASDYIRFYRKRSELKWASLADLAAARKLLTKEPSNNKLYI